MTKIKDTYGLFRNIPGILIPQKRPLYSVDNAINIALNNSNMNNGYNPPKANMFGLGGQAIGGIAQAAATTVGQIGEAINMSKEVKEKSENEEKDLRSQIQSPVNASSTDDLLNQWSSWNPVKTDYNWKDLTNKGTAGSFIMDSLTMGTQGGAAGAQAGGAFGGMGSMIGAAAGTASGMLTGALGNAMAKRAAKKQAKELNKIGTGINNHSLRQFGDEATELDDRMFRKEQSQFIGAYGGKKPSANEDIQDLSIINEGGTHEENPNGGVPMGKDANGTPNLVEQGELVYKDMVISNRIPADPELKSKYGKEGDVTCADVAKTIMKSLQENPNDPITKRTVDAAMGEVIMYQENFKTQLGMNNEQQQPMNQIPTNTQQTNNMQQIPQMGMQSANTYAFGIPDITKMSDKEFTEYKDKVADLKAIPLTYSSDKFKKAQTTAEANNKKIPYVALSPEFELKTKSPSSLPFDFKNKMKEFSERLTGQARQGQQEKELPIYSRYADMFNNAAKFLSDAMGLSNKPTYDNARRIAAANRQLNNVSTESAGQLLGYEPQDQWSQINNFNNQMSAQRAYNANFGNRVGAANTNLASAFNQNQALGALYSNMDNTNFERLAKIATHNTGIYQADRQAQQTADNINANLSAMRAENLIKAANSMENEETAYANARNTNRDTFFHDIANYGKELANNGMLKALIKSGAFGTQNEAMLNALYRLTGMDFRK